MPAAGQRSAVGQVQVAIPPLSELEVEAPRAVDAEAGLQRVRIRANHGWRIYVAAPASDQTVWVRGDGEAYRPLGPGMETELTTGARGETTIEVAYRTEAGAGGEVQLNYRLESAM